MEQQNRILVLHRNWERASQIGDFLQNRGRFQVKCIHAGMDGVPTFEWFRPQVTFLELGIMDLPVDALANAFRQMEPDVRIWLCADEPSEALTEMGQRIGAAGLCVLPLTDQILEDIAGLNSAPSVEPAADSEINGNVDETFVYSGNSLIWQERTSRHEPVEKTAEELNSLGTYSHLGPLKVIGDIEGMERLDVNGALVVQGDIRRSTVRCEGPLMVRGSIEACFEGGVYCRNNLQVTNIFDSFIVVGKNLWLGRQCIDSRVNVVQRLVAKSENSVISGGELRVGEHISIGVLGDDEQTLTKVSVGDPIFRRFWIREKRRQWRLGMSQEPQMGGVRASKFGHQVADARFYQYQAEVLAAKVFPGIDITIGNFDDYVFIPRDRPVRIALGRKKNQQISVMVRPKGKKKKSDPRSPSGKIEFKMQAK